MVSVGGSEVNCGGMMRRRVGGEDRSKYFISSSRERR